MISALALSLALLAGQSAPTSHSTPDPRPAAAAREAETASIPFSMRNRSALPKRVEIAGNVLDFGPFEVRQVGFPAGTSVHVYDRRRPDGRGRLLFTVTAEDRGRRFGV